MNPDIQRIAEKWSRCNGTDPNVVRAIEEFSALRDTQERELREKASDLERKLQKAWLTIDELNERYIEDNI